MQKKALGRGLGALIPDLEQPEPAPSEIDIDRIKTNPVQPRLKLDESRLEELAASIRENGILQPVLVRPTRDGYQLVAGERRLAAAQRAGLLRIPAVVREVPDERLLELALVENIQREQLNPIEEAQACHNLMDTLRMTQEELAARLGKERSTVANALRLLKLPAAVKALVADGKLSPGHARALLSMNSPPAEVSKLAARMVAQGWSVREAEKWAKRESKKPRRMTPEDPNVAAASDRLRLILGTKVEIKVNRDSRGSGQVRIHFFSQEDLMRIYGILTSNTKTNGATV
ncbi:MAG: chromosome segregation DNA-binding protein [Acidobacteria bacterium]|nr:chromosome segregation DNA-binding protein [Acidobacteriota bacterium]